MCVTSYFFLSKTGIQATRTVVFRLLSPVSLIPIHHVVSVSSRGWGMTLDPYAIHWLTWSTKGIVYSWCKGSLPGRKAPIGMKINTSIISELTSHHQYRHQQMRSPIIVLYNWEDYLENIQWEIQAVLDLSVKLKSPSLAPLCLPSLSPQSLSGSIYLLQSPFWGLEWERLTFLGMISFWRRSCGVKAKFVLSPIKLYKIIFEGLANDWPFLTHTHAPKVGMPFCPLYKWIRVTECINIVDVIPWENSSTCRQNWNM